MPNGYHRPEMDRPTLDYRTPPNREHRSGLLLPLGVLEALGGVALVAYAMFLLSDRKFPSLIWLPGLYLIYAGLDLVLQSERDRSISTLLQIPVLLIGVAGLLYGLAIRADAMRTGGLMWQMDVLIGGVMAGLGALYSVTALVAIVVLVRSRPA
jgi:hypothetical protein